MRQVKVFLLVGAVEVIGESEEYIGGWRLRRPLRVLAVPIVSPQGLQIVMQLIPLIGSAAPDSIDLSPSDIIGQPMEPAKQVCDTYLQMTSGIQIAH